MLPISDRTRRRITLGLFALVGLAPTAILLGWGIWRHLPGHLQQHAQRLSWQLGMKVSLARVQHPRPGTVRYEGMVLSDPETGREAVRCRALEVCRADWSLWQKPARDRLRLAAIQPEIDAAALEELWGLLQRVLTGRAGDPQAEVEFEAGWVAIRVGPGWQTVDQVKGTIQTLPEGTLAKVAFRPAAQPDAKPAWLYAGRYRQGPRPVTVLGLDTAGSELPCSLLGLVAEGLDALGARSRFAGLLDARETDEGWQIILSGRFAEVDLGSLVSGCFPGYRISGTAELYLERAVILDGRLQKATGWLSAGPGELGVLLLDAAIKGLGLVGDPALGRSDQQVPYEQLAVGFSLDSGGLRLEGLCRAAGSGTILVTAQGPVVSQPRVQPISLAALAGWVAAPGAWPMAARSPVPVGLGEWLLRRLPVPEAVRFGLLPEQALPSQASRSRMGGPQ